MSKGNVVERSHMLTVQVVHWPLKPNFTVVNIMVDNMRTVHRSMNFDHHMTLPEALIVVGTDMRLQAE